jgi:hypothetical protein
MATANFIQLSNLLQEQTADEDYQIFCSHNSEIDYQKIINDIFPFDYIQTNINYASYDDILDFLSSCSIHPILYKIWKEAFYFKTKFYFNFENLITKNIITHQLIDNIINNDDIDILEFVLKISNDNIIYEIINRIESQKNRISCLEVITLITKYKNFNFTLNISNILANEKYKKQLLNKNFYEKYPFIKKQHFEFFDKILKLIFDRSILLGSYDYPDFISNYDSFEENMNNIHRIKYNDPRLEDFTFFWNNVIKIFSSLSKVGKNQYKIFNLLIEFNAVDIYHNIKSQYSFNLEDHFKHFESEIDKFLTLHNFSKDKQFFNFDRLRHKLEAINKFIR